MDTPVANWLNKVGCPHLVMVFETSNITFEMLPVLTERDLLNMGVPVLDAKQLLKHIKLLEKRIVKEAKARGVQVNK